MNATDAPHRPAAGADLVARPQQVRPYPPSWVNRFTDWLERLPGPLWLPYLILVAIALPIEQLQPWITGTLPFGTLSADAVVYAISAVYPLALLHYLGGAARRAWARFRPAVEMTDDEAEATLYRLTVIPARPALAIVALILVLAIPYYATDPYALQAPVLALVLRNITELPAGILALMVTYNAIRQLRLVARLHERAEHINPFAPGPALAFSVLTAQTAIGLSIIAVPALVGPPEVVASAWSLGWLIAVMALAGATFVLPLRGLHNRLVAEKGRLAQAVGDRIAALSADLHRVVDDAAAVGPDAELPVLQAQQVRADTLNKTLASLVQERDMVSHVSTWPWDAGTLRAVVGALGLPLTIWLITRLAERVV
jgi:hypothetical protein